MAKRKSDMNVNIVRNQTAVSPVQVAIPAKIELDFDAWWMLVSQMRGLKPGVKAAVKKHFEARGFMANKNFDDGLKDFGF